VLYIDTSSLLKLLWQEAESDRTRQSVYYAWLRSCFPARIFELHIEEGFQRNSDQCQKKRSIRSGAANCSRCPPLTHSAFHCDLRVMLLSFCYPRSARSIPEFRPGLPLQASRLKIGLRLDYVHHRLHRGDHDARLDFSLGPFPQGFTWSWQAERAGMVTSC
jgi:hypothetical protein